MQIALGKWGPGQVPVVDRPSEAEQSVESVRVLKIRVFLIIENRLLRDTLAHLLRRQGDVELSGKSASGETNPEEVAKSGCDVALLDFLDPEWIAVVRKQSEETGRAIKTVVIGMDVDREQVLQAVRCGVTAYLLKDVSAADVTAAVRSVAYGEASCPPQMRDAVSDGGANGTEWTGEEIDGQNGSHTSTAKVDEGSGEGYDE